MKLFIMPNLDKKNAKRCTVHIVKKLNEYNANILMDIRYGDEFPELGIDFMDFYKGLSDADVVIAVGGDGTIIHSAKHAVIYNKPLLGINVGRLGFMAGLEMYELDLLKNLVEGNYKTEDRIMLRCLHHSCGVHHSGDEHNSNNVVHEYTALNDVVVSNGSLSRIIDLDIMCQGKNIVSYRADGIILSTPTGSTAYALSAGGPIIEPSLNSIVMTPICPHSLVARPVIFSEEKIITVKGAKLNRHPIYITIDGEEGAKLEDGDQIEVMKSTQFVRLINLNEKSFYEVLNEKFKIRTDEY